MPDDERALKVSVANNILTISYRIDEFYDFNEKGAIELSISNGSTFQVDISHAYLDDPSNESDVIKPVKP
ncbi:MAG: hypothetical protein K1X55_11060 [Chitinophagales bacterium]|nr:hypothetical protein [Chitinophagales bacterium]